MPSHNGTPTESFITNGKVIDKSPSYCNYTLMYISNAIRVTVIVILDNDVSGEILLLHLYSEPSLYSWECGFRHRGVYDSISRHYHSHSFQSNLHKPQPKSFSTFLSLDNHKPVCKMKGERNTKLLKVLHQHITRIALCSLFIFDFVCPVKSPI